jgi:hypothetical protein
MMNQEKSLSQQAFDHIDQRIITIQDSAAERGDWATYRDAERARASLYQFSVALEIEGHVRPQ